MNTYELALEALNELKRYLKVSKATSMDTALDLQKKNIRIVYAYMGEDADYYTHLWYDANLDAVMGIHTYSSYDKDDSLWSYLCSFSIGLEFALSRSYKLESQQPIKYIPMTNKTE